jgi:predicted dehydrogenase
MTLAVGLVGCGRWGAHILRDLVALGIAVRVVAPSCETRSRALANGAAEAAESTAEIAGRVDGFVVATPAVTHAEVVETLLATAKPIFVEKPLTSDVAAARRIAARGRGRVFVMDKWRYHPGVVELAAQVREGRLGRVLAIHSFRLGWGHPHRDVDAIWTLLPHDLSIVLHLTGTIPPLVSARPLLGTQPEQGVLATFRADGPTVTVMSGSAVPVARRSVVVVGEEASAELGDSYDEAITLRRGRPGDPAAAASAVAIAADMPLLLELKSFCAHLCGGPPPLSPVEDGLLIVERIAAVRAALGL